MCSNSNLIWISAGEASGDMYGASLASELLQRDPSATLRGMGGRAMREAGVQVEFPFELISLVGFFEIFSALPRVLTVLKQSKDKLRELMPKALVCIDCPDFHFRLIKFASKLGIPVYYYISPQIWAWRSKRVYFLQKYVRKVLCILPFEEAFYAKFGVKAQYVGHPLMDRIPFEQLDAMEHEQGRIAILPGSRKREIKTLLPVFAEAARIILEHFPNARFDLIRAPGVHRETLLALWPEDIELTIHDADDRYQALKRCEIALAASGTVTLEAALIGTPTILSYQLSALSFVLSKFLIKVRFAGLPNLIMDREIFPEMLQEKSEPRAVAQKALAWLADKQSAMQVRLDIQQLRKIIGESGASGRAAQNILEDLEKA